MSADFWIVLQWWGTLLLIGAMAFPFTKKLFSSWWDWGYFFAKAVGMAFVTYFVYLMGIIHVLPFTSMSIFAGLTTLFVIGIFVNARKERGELNSLSRIMARYKNVVLVIIMEELIFFIAILFWSWVKGHEPTIHGLEKFMDYGFMKSILNSNWFPAPDMWYAGYPINYYYFGHTVVAVLTRLSGVDLANTFNLMLATIFAFTLTMAYSIGYQLLRITGKDVRSEVDMASQQMRFRIRDIAGGCLTAFLVTLAGNMQTIYAFTKGYIGEDVKPFWELLWPLAEFWTKLPEGLERYWYANATRFIPFTIHEFPSYSFVVSDVHGHVLSLPFVLLSIALLIMMFAVHKRGVKSRASLVLRIFYGLLVAILLMTNALDGPIYMGLFILLAIVSFGMPRVFDRSWWKELFSMTLPVAVTAGAASIPFMSHFKSFVSGLAINCPPAFLAGQKIGIFLFEGVEKCQHSPLWMMLLLWGFFIYCGVGFLTRFYRKNTTTHSETKITQLDSMLIVFFFFSLSLIIFPEFFYFKDIYPAHFRSNTMFKLGYDAFILFSILSGYVIARAVNKTRGEKRTIAGKLFLICMIPQLFLVSIYPIFSVRSYFDSLRTYKGLDGLAWFAAQYPDDYAGILWLNKHADMKYSPVIVEADGDSYTDNARYSAYTGLPTIVGWAVHEWLWRGTYDVVAPRREEVRVIYESDDLEKTRTILQKYNVKYIVVGYLERQKFVRMNEQKFDELGTLVFTQGTTQIYDVRHVE